MSLNALPSFNKRSILGYLPIDGTATAMRLVSKKWENLLPFEGHLDLSKVPVSNDELVEIIKHFQEKDIKIVSIDLSNSTITDDGLELLASSHFPIQRLYLNRCRQITDDGLKHLAVLPLQELNLSRCKIKDTGLKHLAVSHQLTKLNLSFTSVTDKGLGYLAGLPLTALDLTGCKKVSRFASSFPALFFPKILPNPSRSEYAIQFLLQMPDESTIDVEDFRKKSAEKLTPLLPPSELQIIQSYVDSNARSMLAKDAIAPHLQTLPSSPLRIYSTYVDSEFRSELFKQAVLPLLEPLSSIKSLIAPLQTFAKKQMQTDPKFAVYLIAPKSGNKNSGEFSPVQGTIEIFIKDQSKKIDTTVLLHELSHKAYRALGWDTVPNALLKAKVAADIHLLKRDDWDYCAPEVEALLKSVEKRYEPEERFEEYLVRMPEIFTLIAQKNPTRSSSWVEKRVKRDIPRLYEIYTKKFLPQLKQYNKQ